jgi:hypothetical protein
VTKSGLGRRIRVRLLHEEKGDAKARGRVYGLTVVTKLHWQDANATSNMGRMPMPRRANVLVGGRV